MVAELNVWMNGQLVGVWSLTRSKTSVFRYAPSWVASDKSRPLSLSLPLTVGNAEIRGEKVQNYFDNLLPDSQAIRDRIRLRHRTKSSDAFELLTAIGRDCVGAVQLLPPDMEPTGWDAVHSEPMADAQVAQLLRATTSSLAMGQQPDAYQAFRISIAGAQEKTALLRYAGQWRRPLGATPTTHILKLPLGLVGNMRADMRESVENEWLCSKILQALHFPVAPTDMASFEDQKVLVVERFDRRWQGIPQGAQQGTQFRPTATTWIARLPQEDFCQIAGLAPTQKYEADGGPSMRQCLEQLAGSQDADEDRARFVLAQLAFWLLAATDGHAKNFSIFLQSGGTFRLTPLYDVLSAWPVIGRGANMIPIHDAKLAMGLHATSTHYKIKEIRIRHWKLLAQTCGVAGVWERMLALVDRVERALADVERQLPPAFPPNVWDKVHAGTLGLARQFQRESQAPSATP